MKTKIWSEIEFIWSELPPGQLLSSDSHAEVPEKHGGIHFSANLSQYLGTWQRVLWMWWGNKYEEKIVQDGWLWMYGFLEIYETWRFSLPLLSKAWAAQPTLAA